MSCNKNLNSLPLSPHFKHRKITGLTVKRCWEVRCQLAAKLSQERARNHLLQKRIFDLVNECTDLKVELLQLSKVEELGN